MRVLKLFLTYPPIELPHRWARAVNPHDYHSQGYVLIIAPTKAVGWKELTWEGIHDTEARRIMRATQMVGDQVSDDLAAILDAGIINVGRPSIYAWRRSMNDCPIIRVHSDELPVIGTFVRASDRSAALTVQPTGTENRA